MHNEVHLGRDDTYALAADPNPAVPLEAESLREARLGRRHRAFCYDPEKATKDTAYRLVTVLTRLYSCLRSIFLSNRVHISHAREAKGHFPAWMENARGILPCSRMRSRYCFSRSGLHEMRFQRTC